MGYRREGGVRFGENKVNTTSNVVLVSAAANVSGIVIRTVNIAGRGDGGVAMRVALTVSGVACVALRSEGGGGGVSEFDGRARYVPAGQEVAVEVSSGTCECSVSWDEL